MSKKLIALDMDGTLLNSKHRITDKTKEVLKKAIKDGHIVVISSGRPWRAIKDYYQDLGCNGPVITLNGMHTFNPCDSSFKELKYILKKDDVLDIVDRAKDIITDLCSESESQTYLGFHKEYLNAYFPYMRPIYGDFRLILKEDVYTAIFDCNAKDLGKLEEIANSHYPIKWRKWCGSSYSELYIDGVNKGSCLKYIQEQLGIKKEDTIAFGDSINDLEMFNEAGVRYLMSNTNLETIPEEAIITEKDNNNDGIAIELEKVLPANEISELHFDDIA